MRLQVFDQVEDLPRELLALLQGAGVAEQM